MNKYEIDLVNAIAKRCNEFAIVSGMHTANVAYAPTEWFLMNKGDSRCWELKSPNVYILLNTITVYLKEEMNPDRIAVSHMETPRDEMLVTEIADGGFINIEKQCFLKSHIMYYSPVFNDADEIVGIKLFFKNITNSALIEASPERLIELLKKLDTIFKTVTL